MNTQQIYILQQIIKLSIQEAFLEQQYIAYSSTMSPSKEGQEIVAERISELANKIDNLWRDLSRTN